MSKSTKKCGDYKAICDVKMLRLFRGNLYSNTTRATAPARAAKDTVTVAAPLPFSNGFPLEVEAAAAVPVGLLPPELTRELVPKEPREVVAAAVAEEKALLVKEPPVAEALEEFEEPPMFAPTAAHASVKARREYERVCRWDRR